MSRNVVICVKKKKNGTEQELFPGYSLEQAEYTEQNNCCWNCTHSFDSNNLVSIPVRFEQGIFYVTGYFCSPGCGYRYIYDTYKDKELWEKYELLKYYFRIIYGENIDIKVPPNKLLLEKFGGNLTIEEYKNKDKYNIIINPPIIIIANNSEQINQKENNDYLKLYRKKNKKENTILNNMKINN